MRSVFLLLSFLAATGVGFAQESLKVDVVRELPPDAIATEVRESLNRDGYRIQDKEGLTIANIWLRKAIPASEQPSEPKGAILYPFLADGELVGVLQFATKGHDYRDQPIAKGVYTLRYGLQPVNGDHLGVSTFRDYSMILPVHKDRTLALPPRKQLEELSAESAGTSHPAVLLLEAAPPNASKSEPAVIHNAEKNTWSVVLPLSLRVKGQAQSVACPVSLVVVGVAAA